MTGFEGVQIDAANQTASMMRAYAAQLETKVQEITASLPETKWTGRDADRFREDWAGTFSVNLRNAVDELRKHATKLSDRAERQAKLSKG